MFEPVIDLGTFRRSSAGTIAGRIHIRLHDYAFPSPDWSDLPVVIVGWWLDAIHLALRGGSGELRFMDGPFCVTVERRHRQDFDVKFTNRGTAERDAAVTIEVMEGFNEALHALAVDVLSLCDSRGWTGGGVEDLRATLTR